MTITDTAHRSPSSTVSTVRTLDIGIDLDGVCYPFVDALRDWITASTGRPADTMPPATCWEFFDKDWNMSLEEFLAHNNAGVNAGVIFREGAPLPGTMDALPALVAAGHRLHVITDRDNVGRPGIARAATMDWLTRWDFPYTSVHFTADKTSVRTDAFIEDRPKNYDALRASGVQAFLITTRYNAGHPATHRVANWSQFVERIADLAANT